MVCGTVNSVSGSVSIRHVVISNGCGRRWNMRIIISPTVWMGRAMAPPANFASFSGADLALAADVTTAFCPYMEERQIQLVFAGCRRDLIARGAAFRASSHSAAPWPPTLWGRRHISKDTGVQAISAACSWAFVWSSSGSAGQRADKRGFCLSCPLKRHVVLYHLTAYCHRTVKPGKMAKQTEELWKEKRQMCVCVCWGRGCRKGGRKVSNRAIEDRWVRYGRERH